MRPRPGPKGGDRSPPLWFHTTHALTSPPVACRHSHIPHTVSPERSSIALFLNRRRTAAASDTAHRQPLPVKLGKEPQLHGLGSSRSSLHPQPPPPTRSSPTRPSARSSRHEQQISRHKQEHYTYIATRTQPKRYAKQMTDSEKRTILHPYPSRPRAPPPRSPLRRTRRRRTLPPPPP